jgi:hypothetical protein
MPTMKVSVPHSLDPEEATRRIKNLVGDIKKQFADKVSDVKEEWNGHRGQFSFKAMGFDIAGTVDIDSREVQIKGNLPFAASFFKSRIESTIQEKARELLA